MRLCDDLLEHTDQQNKKMLTERFIESLEFDNVRRLMYGLHGSGFANEMDIQRWHEQGFQFFSEPLLLYNSNESAYGLVQSKGPISAFLLTSTQCHNATQTQ